MDDHTAKAASGFRVTNSSHARTTSRAECGYPPGERRVPDRPSPSEAQQAPTHWELIRTRRRCHDPGFARTLAIEQSLSFRGQLPNGAVAQLLGRHQAAEASPAAAAIRAQCLEALLSLQRQEHRQQLATRRVFGARNRHGAALAAIPAIFFSALLLQQATICYIRLERFAGGNICQ
eukprot:scaffold129484_cov63-Phaeocystis_antarctica.AAC.3